MLVKRETIYDYMNRFIACEGPCKENVVLRVLRNQESHFSILAINVAKEECFAVGDVARCDSILVKLARIGAFLTTQLK